MGYINKDKKINKELTIRFTELGKKHLVNRDKDLSKITKYNLGDSDINYNTIQDNLEITDFSGENNCADTSKFDLLKNEIFENGLTNSFNLLNTSGYGRLQMNKNMITQFNSSFTDIFFSYFSRFKIKNEILNFYKTDNRNPNPTQIKILTDNEEVYNGEPYPADIFLLTTNSFISLGNGIQFKLFIGGNLTYIKIEYSNVRFGNTTFRGEITYNINLSRDKYYNLVFEKSNDIEASFDMFLNGNKLPIKKHIYFTQTEGIPQERYGHLYSQGIIECSRVFALNRPLTYNEKKNGHLLTNNYVGSRYFDLQLREGIGSLVSDTVSGNQNNILSLDWIV